MQKNELLYCERPKISEVQSVKGRSCSAQHAPVYLRRHHKERCGAIDSHVARQEANLSKCCWRRARALDVVVGTQQTCADPKVSQNSRNFWLESALMGVVLSLIHI